MDIAEMARRIYAAGTQRPRYLMRASFVFAWSRRWKAHWLSKALGYPSAEPQVR
jgi:hypothetical protein